MDLFTTATRRSRRISWIAFGLIAAIALLAGSSGRAQTGTIDEFFRTFTADWIRHDPDMATRVRYLTGDEQAQLERQLTPVTRAWREEPHQPRKGRPRSYQKLRSHHADSD